MNLIHSISELLLLLTNVYCCFRIIYYGTIIFKNELYQEYLNSEDH